MKKIFIAATVVCLSLVTLTGCSVAVRESSEDPDAISLLDLDQVKEADCFVTFAVKS